MTIMIKKYDDRDNSGDNDDADDFISPAFYRHTSVPPLRSNASSSCSCSWAKQQVIQVIQVRQVKQVIQVCKYL